MGQYYESSYLQLYSYLSTPIRGYYCGPTGFVATVEGILDDLHIPATRRFTETFGPSQGFSVAAQAPATPV